MSAPCPIRAWTLDLFRKYGSSRTVIASQASVAPRVPHCQPAIAKPVHDHLLRQFFRSLPRALADIARIDGANELGIYWRIIMPLAKPALASVAVFTFINSWTGFIGPLLYPWRDPTKYTVALGPALLRQAFIGRTHWNLVMAGTTLMILQVILVLFMA
ncbi:MAG: carbohydrate ABC transporter permease [Caldilineaceae bacterium SB0661_bin_34]|nr:carbohydrate ABC transporter permease [Caldilineaceae bacterium SB0661_bin_34]